MSLVLCLALLVGGDGNRLWWLEVEARGPLEEFTLDCGQDGSTRVRGPFLAGERRLVVPVPVRSPLGAEGLAALALPRPGHAGVRVLGWSVQQADTAFAREARGLLVRGRPPITGLPPRAGRAEAALVLCTLALLVRLRRRAGLAAGLGLLVGLFLLVRSAAREPEARPVELVEVDLGAGRALRVRAARGELDLGRTRLEVRPEEAALAFEVPADGSAGVVRAPGVELFDLERSALPVLQPARGERAFEALWVRTSAGVWSSHGAWEAGRPLPAPLPAGAAPPGWLTGALPPGTGILLGREVGGSWLRATGFQLPAQESQDG